MNMIITTTTRLEAPTRLTPSINASGIVDVVGSSPSVPSVDVVVDSVTVSFITVSDNGGSSVQIYVCVCVCVEGCEKGYMGVLMY